MSCRRAFDVDLAAFLADPRSEQLAAFREHYPRCPACAAEVRVWTELSARLGSGPGAGHPQPGLLLRYQEGPAGLEPGERLRVSAHLERCASCRDELATLRGFDPGVLRAPVPAVPSDPRSGLAAWLDALRRVLWHPGLAYALALMATAPALYLWVTPTRPALHGDAAAVVRSERARAPLAEGPVRAEEPAPEASLAPERWFASSPEEKDAPQHEPVAPGAPSDALFQAPGQLFGEEMTSEQLRARGDALPAAPEPGARVLDRTQKATLEDAGGGVFVLLVPVDPSAREVEIRVVSPDSRRELAQRFEAGASDVELRIPASWLEPGTQRIERRLDDRTEVFFVEVP